MICDTGAKYSANKIGPKTDPCGTPNCAFHGSENSPEILMRDDHPERYDRIHFRVVPDI